jgi:Leucine-rich repeat (LRR) protein
MDLLRAVLRRSGVPSANRWSAPRWLQLALVGLVGWSALGCITVYSDPSVARPDCATLLVDEVECALAEIALGCTDFLERPDAGCVLLDCQPGVCFGPQSSMDSEPLELWALPSWSRGNLETAPWGAPLLTRDPPAGTRTPQPTPHRPAVARSPTPRRAIPGLPGALVPARPLAIPLAERTALLAFHDALAGAGWHQRSGWGGAPGSECNWFGVLCNAAGTRVTGLFFPDDNNLAGAIPDAISGLGALEILLLHDQGITGLPATLGQLRELRTLSLPGNRLSGPLPGGLAQLTKLRHLALAGNQLSGPLPAFLGSATALEVLDLADNQLTGPIPNLGGLAALRRLDLSANALSGGLPASLGSLGKLESLAVAANQLSGPIPAALGNLTALRGLFLSGNQLTGPVPASLANLRRLTALMLGPNQLSGALPNALAPLSSLQVLYLPAAGLSGALPDIATMANLEELHLAYNAFDPGPMPAALSSRTRLRVLDLRSTRRTGAILDLASLPLEVLALGDNAFAAGPVPPWVLGKRGLEFLDLSATQRNGPLPASFGSNPPDVLILDRNPFSAGPIPPGLLANGNLDHLGLAGTNRTGPIPDLFANTRGLAVLTLGDNDLTGGIPPSLERVFFPRLIDLANNQLSGPVPEWLGNRNTLVSLTLQGNKLGGGVPESFASADNFLPSGFRDAFGRAGVGVDLRFNALSMTAQVAAALAPHHPNRVNPLAAQTLPPRGVTAKALSRTSIEVRWTPIAYQQGPGGYSVLLATSASGPFTGAGSVTPKSARQLVLTGLQPNTLYFVQVQTSTRSYGNNSNLVRSRPSAAISVRTPP